MEGLSPIRFVSPSFVTNSLGTNDPKLGDLCIASGTHYRFVYNAGNSQISTGQGVILSAASDYSVTVSSVTSIDCLVGVCKNATIATGYYGFVVQRGFTNVVMSANTGASAGDLLVLAADGNFITKTISTGFVSPGLVKAMSAIATAASGLAYVSVG